MIVYNDGCVCITRGEDDGSVTCWMHHDCAQGYCTHIEDNEQEPDIDIDCGD